MPSDRHTIIYTHTDEAPALATKLLLPVVNAFTNIAGATVETRNGTFTYVGEAYVRDYTEIRS